MSHSPNSNEDASLARESHNKEQVGNFSANNSDTSREFKHDVYGRRQTAKSASDFLFSSCNL